jgi:hypothetical protein
MTLPYSVIPCPRSWIKEFVERWHYSGSINGLKTTQCFALISENNKMIGAALFGTLGMANNWKKFSDKEEDVLELHRLCCIDDTLKNTESYFISRCIRWLKQNTSIRIVVSYADENHNHKGVIYQAANFKYLGQTAPSKMIKHNGKFYHEKTIRTYYKGELKPYAKKLRDALNTGDAQYVDTKFKHCYIYLIERKGYKKEPAYVAIAEKRLEKVNNRKITDFFGVED